MVGVRLTSDELILDNSSFAEKTLTGAGEDYDRRMRLKPFDLNLDVVMDVVCVHLGVKPAELSGPSLKQQICQALALISDLAVRELRISGADVARRMNIDRSSVSRSVGRVQADPALKNMSNALLDHLYPIEVEYITTKQQQNNVPLPLSLKHNRLEPDG